VNGSPVLPKSGVWRSERAPKPRGGIGRPDVATRNRLAALPLSYGVRRGGGVCGPRVELALGGLDPMRPKHPASRLASGGPGTISFSGRGWLSFQGSGSPTPAPPTDGLRYWVQPSGATVGGGTVSAWPDPISGIVVVPDGAQPAYTPGAILGKPGVTFSGAEVLKFAASPLPAGNTPRTVMIVANLPHAGGCLMCIGKDGGWFGPTMALFGTSGSFSILTPTGFGGIIVEDTTGYTSVPIAIEYEYDGVGGLVSVSINGRAMTLTGNTGGTDSADFLTIGNYWNLGPGAIPANGSLGDMLIYDRRLSLFPVEQAALRSYIDAEYPVFSTFAFLPYGDSITFGVGATTISGYEQPTLQALNSALRTRGTAESAHGGSGDRWHYNAGYGGATTTVLLEQVDGTLSSLFPCFNAEAMLLHAGANDVAANNPTLTADNLVAIAQQYLTDHPAGQVFVMETLFGRSDNVTMNTFVAALRPLIVAGFAGVPHTTVVTPPLIPDVGYSDSIHPNDLGYTLMADDGAGNGWVPALRAAGF
jgi:lysophospholipase L1-like esterase